MSRKPNPLFLATVMAARFAKIQKVRDPRPGHRWDRKREVITLPNPHPEGRWVIVGTQWLREGRITWIDDEAGYGFVQTATQEVYILARSMGSRKLALPQDVSRVSEVKS